MFAAWLLGAGRLARVPYAIGIVLTIFLTGAVVFGYIMLAYGARGDNETLLGVWFCAGLIAGLYAAITQLIRRLHDFGQTGWHAAWIAFASLIGVMSQGGIWSTLALGINLAVALWPGDPGPNRFDQPSGARPGANSSHVT